MDKSIATFFSLSSIFAAIGLAWMGFSNGKAPVVGDTRIAVQESLGDQNIPARLWEDPLQVVQTNMARGDHDDSLARLSSRIADRADELCVLAIPIPDTPFPGDQEVRLRMRYSVQMAMTARGYVPENRDYLGCAKVQMSPAYLASKHLPTHVPFEWFKNTQANVKRRYTLILWFPEGQLNGQPLAVLQTLKEQMFAPLGSKVYSTPFFMIGPRSSDTLTRLVPAPSLVQPLLQDPSFAIFSPFATAPDALIGLEPFKKWNCGREDLKNRLAILAGGRRDVFHNFIALDDQLTDLLVHELVLRGLVFSGQKKPKGMAEDKILILAEADTSHGRALPLAMQASIEACRTNGKSSKAEATASSTPMLLKKLNEKPKHDAQLVTYRYLRGLDLQKGQQTGTSSRPRAPVKSAEEALTEVLRKEGALPLGESQLDYVERLIEDIQADRDVKNIKAVGVLGGDIYDKLILLRSLRSKFPGAVFFTTDLDARLWHPDYLAFTRNLIVASAYDITLPKEGFESSSIAPFRDVYQVSIFRACQAALDQAAGAGGHVRAGVPLPVIFELGLKGPHKLLTSRRGDSAPPYAHFMMADGKNLAGPIFAFLAIFAGASSLIFCGDLAQKMKKTLGRQQAVLWMTGILIFFFLWMALIQVCSLTLDSEPWAWNEGLSCWPTETVRFVILCVSVFFVYQIRRRSAQLTDMLRQDFVLDRGLKRPSVSRWTQRLFRPLITLKCPVGGWGLWWGLLLRWLAPGWLPQSNMSAERVFRAFAAQSAPWRRVIRVVLAVFAYWMMAAGCIYLVEGQIVLPRPNIRGTAVREIDFWLLHSCVLAFLILVFYVLDVVVMAACFLKGISGPDTVWPKALVKKYSKKNGVPGSHLSGYLDVQVAAQASQMTSYLIFLPIFVQLLMILSRNTYFDNWPTPVGLIVIFIGNIVLSLTAWFTMRKAARELWSEAKTKMQNQIHRLSFKIAASKNPQPFQALRIRLEVLMKEIEGERRGAFANFFQDPALVGVLIPAGAWSIIAVICHALFGVI